MRTSCFLLFLLFVSVTCTYSFRKYCKNGRRPYPLPWHHHRPMPHPQYNVVPPPLDVRYYHHVPHWRGMPGPDYRPFPPLPQPVNPVPIIDPGQGTNTFPVPNPNPVVPVLPSVPDQGTIIVPNPGPNPVIPDPKPGPVIPDPVPGPVIPDPVPGPVIPDPGPDPSRVDSAGAASDIGSRVLQQNSIASPDGLVFLSQFNSGFPMMSEVLDPEIFTKSKSCSVRDSSGCPVGEQCVIADVVSKMYFTCKDLPSTRCHCQPGCRFQDTFIPYGQSAVVGPCRNKCSCLNMYGNIECEKKTC